MDDCHPMMWQSSMLISLLVLSPEQIIVSIWVSHDISCHRPITLLEPLVVLIRRHKDMLVLNLRYLRLGERERSD